MLFFFDDDKYNRAGWERSAKQKGIKLLALASSKDFSKFQNQITKDAVFYIDRELGSEEPKGEDFAKELFERGYHNLYLATGFDPDYFGELPWIKGFLGKESPWEDSSDW